MRVPKGKPMTRTIECEKGEFVTIEFFLDEDQEERFEDGDLDFYYVDRLALSESIEEAIYDTLSYNKVTEKVYVFATARRYATIEVDDEGDLEGVVDYGDGCMGGDDYVYDGETLHSGEYYDT